MDCVIRRIVRSGPVGHLAVAPVAECFMFATYLTADVTVALADSELHTRVRRARPLQARVHDPIVSDGSTR